MGLKLLITANPIACWFEDEHLHYEIGTSSYKLHVPNTAGLIIQKQCNMFQARTVNAFLQNDKYILVLRRSGTGTIYTREGCFIRNLEYDVGAIPLLAVRTNPGIVHVREANRWYIITLFYDFKDNYILSMQDWPYSLTFTKEQNMLYTAQLGVANSLVSKIQLSYEGGVLCQRTEDGDITYVFDGCSCFDTRFRQIV